MRRPTRPIPGLVPTLAALLAGLAVLAAPGGVRANLIGDPTLTNGAGRFGVGGEFDLVFDRDTDDAVSGIDSNRFLVSGSYGFLRNVDGFVKLGVFNGSVDPGGTDINTGLAIGGGARLSFLDQGNFRFGGLGQIMYFNSDLDTGGSPSIDWLEFDFAAAVSYRGLGQIVPYGGIKLSFVEGDVGGNDFHQDNIFGVFGGATFAITPQFNVGAELRLIDETALGFYARFVF